MPADSGRAAEAIANLAWGEAYEVLSAAPPAALEATDLEALAVASYLTGRDDEASAAWDRAHKRHLADGRSTEAARCAFWTALCLMLRGQMAHAGGWLSRAQALIGDDDCPAAGYLLIPTILGALDSDDPATACDLALEAGAIAQRFGDLDLRAFATLGQGHALVAVGDDVGGMARLDEVMVSVSCGEVGPITSGIVYCAVILECVQAYDLSRAAEWTSALDDWCSRQPDLVPYRGQCLVHRSQIEQATGDWVTARSIAGEACHLLSEPPHPALGLACYQRGELHRLAGDLDRAAAAYREASRCGFEPMPGVALLDRARGDLTAATAGITRALGEAAQPFQRPGLLAAAVEIHGATADVGAARAAAEELLEISARSRSEVLDAIAAQAMGAALLAEGSATAALAHLRASRSAWQRLRMPYEAARAAALVGRACLALGDHTSATLALEYARDVFQSLDARTDLAELDGIEEETGNATPGLLSSREREVLALVAHGNTNPEIAAALSISRHTVGRHLENIFAKLGVNSRAAATAYAYEHDLI